MNSLHLIWIVPAAVSFGFIIAALVSANKEN